VALASMRQRHAEHCARRLDELAPLLRTDQGRLARAVLAEGANVRAAWHTAVATGRADLVAMMVPVLRCFFEVRGRLLEGVAELRLALQAAPAACADGAPADGVAARALARVRQEVAMLHYRAGDLVQAQAVAQAALAPAQACQEWGAVIGSLNVLANCASAAGDYRGAHGLQQRALGLARRHGQRHAQATLLGNLGITEKRLGRLPQALQHYEEALAMARELADTNATVVHLNNLASLHRALGQWPQAQRVLDEALLLCQQHGLANMRPFVHLGLGLLALDRGVPTQAAGPLLQALALAQASGLQQVALSAELGLAAAAIAEGTPAGRQQAGPRLQRVAHQIRERGAASALLVDVAFHHATALAAEGEGARAAPLLAACAAHPTTEARRREQAALALQALLERGEPRPPAADPEATVQAAIDALLHTPA
ncbi:hypothetical protein IP87_15220, partial [beta proteobacterium AAP121]